MANGWTGNILRVNLTTGNITLEDSSKFKSFVGGMGFGYKIMYDEVPPGTKPFDEANKLVFATGPLTGSGAPCSSRVNITSLSTFTKGNLVVDAGNDSNLLIVFYVQRAFTDKQQIKRKAQSFD